ncbi:hypothetical protein PYCCODRAFT_1104161 [Trametes coccinea BRFM310]|uniref:Uncharacterized protein n=1 Tax=Trametes coccinea (strain BRFM310) TaxID=1353009 RepID=A0A1Y2I9G4_TRAC3|nr:hypothetical protein PYCCODRAFT_1104161 [Trametes coccinea BRFM310]
MHTSCTAQSTRTSQGWVWSVGLLAAVLVIFSQRDRQVSIAFHPSARCLQPEYLGEFSSRSHCRAKHKPACSIAVLPPSSHLDDVDLRCNVPDRALNNPSLLSNAMVIRRHMLLSAVASLALQLRERPFWIQT